MTFQVPNKNKNFLEEYVQEQELHQRTKNILIDVRNQQLVERQEIQRLKDELKEAKKETFAWQAVFALLSVLFILVAFAQ